MILNSGCGNGYVVVLDIVIKCDPCIFNRSHIAVSE